jgi:ParB-like chromosome segregation protein Spo0J
MRQLRPDAVSEIAESIQLEAIAVRPYRGKYFLIFGWHRLEAVRKLEHKTIEARVLDGVSADQALMAEIDENLVRADLTLPLSLRLCRSE